MSRLKWKITSYDAFVFLFILTWNRETLFQYVKSVIWRIPIVTYGTQLYVYALFFILIVLAWPYIKTKIRYSDILFYILFLLMYVFDLLSINGTSEYLSENIELILIQIVPVFFIGLAFDPSDKHIFELIHKTSMVSIYLHLFSTLFLTTSVSEMNDAMDLAYRIQPHVLVVGYYYLKEKHLSDLISLAVGVLSLIWFGSRGAFILTILFLVAYYVFFAEHHHKLIFYPFVACAGITFATFSSAIFLFIRDLLANYGIKTRIFDRIVDRTFFMSVGRTDIKEILWQAIQKKPYLGYGIAGDRPICYQVGQVYAHSLPLEILVSYGTILGGILLASLAIIIIRAVWNSRRTLIGDFLLVLIFSSGLLKLFLSSSYLIEYEFFLLIGLCISVIRYNKNAQQNHSSLV